MKEKTFIQLIYDSTENQYKLEIKMFHENIKNSPYFSICFFPSVDEVNKHHNNLQTLSEFAQSFIDKYFPQLNTIII